VAERVADALGVPLERRALTTVPADRLVAVAADLAGEGGDEGLLFRPVVDGGLLPTEPEAAVRAGAASGVPLLIGTTRDEWTFFALGDPVVRSLDHDGLVRMVRRLAPDAAAAHGVIDAVISARSGRGEPVEARDVWSAIATESVFRVPSLRFADAHAAGAAPGTGTHAYLFTRESPLFGGVLGSCHALEIPYVFGSLGHPAVATFAGGDEDAHRLSAEMRRAWTTFARTGVPDAGDGAWPGWDGTRRSTTVLGPWPGDRSVRRVVDRPRAEEHDAVAGVLTRR
jgi:para-nitrobenzyl esterase